MFWTRAILWKIIKVLGYLIGMVRYFPARKKNYFFVPYLTRPHVCRHTYCSNMAKSGMNPMVLQYLMGHSDINVTLNTYTHLKLDDAKEEVEKLAKQQADAEAELRHMGMKDDGLDQKRFGRGSKEA